jgi:hypothetical protein
MASPAEEGDGAPWPQELTDVFATAITAEFAGLTRTGTPITVPTTPYVGDRTLDLSTGLTYPTKAERARRNPKVALLFADPVGSSIHRPPVVAVQGLAAVRDADLQANADRYVRDSLAKLPAATKGQPRFVLRKMAWYYARIWVAITPVRILWWPDRQLTSPPQVWTKPGAIVAPASDASPAGSPPPAWTEPPPSWPPVATFALGSLPWRDLTVVDGDGYPLCLPVTGAEPDPAGFVLQLGGGAPASPLGRRASPFTSTPTRSPGRRTGRSSVASPPTMAGSWWTGPWPIGAWPAVGPRWPWHSSRAGGGCGGACEPKPPDEGNRCRRSASPASTDSSVGSRSSPPFVFRACGYARSRAPAGCTRSEGNP